MAGHGIGKLKVWRIAADRSEPFAVTQHLSDEFGEGARDQVQLPDRPTRGTA